MSKQETGLTRIQITFEGVSPLMQHNEQLANPRSPFAQALKAVTGKRTKTEDDHEEVSRLEWEGGLYHADDIGLYVPSTWPWATLRDAAKMFKKGTAVERGVGITSLRIPLEVGEPFAPKAAWESGRFADVRGVVVMGKRVMRTRPIFSKWAIQFDAEVDTSLLEVEQIAEFAELAGRLIGMGEARRIGYGRFLATVEAYEG